MDGNLFIDTYMLPYILPQVTSGEWPGCQEGEFRSKCINKEMQGHLQRCHKEIMDDVAEQQEELKKRKFNVRSECARGETKIYNLLSQDDRKSFLEKDCHVFLFLGKTVSSETFFI